jgi:hypothetical protein
VNLGLGPRRIEELQRSRFYQGLKPDPKPHTSNISRFQSMSVCWEEDGGKNDNHYEDKQKEKEQKRKKKKEGDHREKNDFKEK